MFLDVEVSTANIAQEQSKLLPGDRLVPISISMVPQVPFNCSNFRDYNSAVKRKVGVLLANCLSFRDKEFVDDPLVLHKRDSVLVLAVEF
ncbi:MAG: hypothetical protein V2I33_24765, partial [Kangiellaceae bacterium]|nr:hypothetical protein [Kangiellaceae bacterium]